MMQQNLYIISYVLFQTQIFIFTIFFSLISIKSLSLFNNTSVACQTGHFSTILVYSGVYTKNRNFRLYLSSKYGKKNPLRLAAENEFEPHSSRNDKAIFMHSLISNVK